MRKLTVKKILEFYDVPQLFVATDAMNSNYLCLLYGQQKGYEYLAVQVSDLRLRSFVGGDLDLRRLYLDPEQDDSLYHVLVEKENIVADRMLSPCEVTEEKLPEAGYYYDADDAIEESNTDTLQIDIPVKDRSFFADIARRMGWSARTISVGARRIAVL